MQSLSINFDVLTTSKRRRFNVSWVTNGTNFYL